MSKLTPEGKIILTLEHGSHRYSELKRETELSDRWLMKKLEELRGQGMVEKDGRWYKLRRAPMIHPYERSLYRRTLQLPKVVEHLLDECPYIQVVILYGSTADGTCGSRSDADLLIVIKDKSLSEAKGEVINLTSELELTHHLSVEPLILTVDDYLADISSREGGIIYGVTSAYEVLYDRTKGELTEPLRDRVREIRENYTYLEDVRQWVKVK